MGKWVIRNQKKLATDRMAEQLSSDESRDFWSEVRNVRANPKDCPSVIDEAVGEDAICALFAEKYDELDSCVSYDERDERLCRCCRTRRRINLL